MAIELTKQELELLVENQRRQIESQDTVIQQIIESKDEIVRQLDMWRKLASERSVRINELEAEVYQMKAVR